MIFKINCMYILKQSMCVACFNLYVSLIVHKIQVDILIYANLTFTFNRYDYRVLIRMIQICYYSWSRTQKLLINHVSSLGFCFVEFLPRPAQRYEDPPLYLCLRVSKPMQRTFSKDDKKSARPSSKGKIPEYWFAIPRDK